MISHKYKCIFIHIQSTAGTSIEKWICGQDWWNIDKKTKHIFASQAKEIYKEYWDNYFKFSFIRNPWDRMVSTLRLKNQIFTYKRNGIIQLDKYKQQYGFPFPLVIECDKRFYKQSDVLNNKHFDFNVYQNILDEDLDFIGAFENLENDIKFIQEKIDIETPFNVHSKKSKDRKEYKEYYNKNSKEEINNIFFYDIKEFGYSF